MKNAGEKMNNSELKHISDREEFRKKLEELINIYSQEKYSDTPDFILAGYLMKCLDAFEIAINRRGKWYGKK